MKKCSCCGIEKTYDQFHNQKASKDGKKSECKVCTIVRKKVYYQANKEKINRNCSKYHVANADKIRSRSWRNRVKRLYGITIEEYEAKKLAQGSKCAICGRLESIFSVGLNLDHCHKTGKLRDFLCGGCNTSIGNFMDDPELLKAAISYLEKHK